MAAPPNPALKRNRSEATEAAASAMFMDKRQRFDAGIRTIKSVADKLRQKIQASQSFGVPTSSVFEIFDTDKDGKINAHEFLGGLKKFGVEVPTNAIDDLHALFDSHAGGCISAAEFAEFVAGSAEAAAQLQIGMRRSARKRVVAQPRKTRTPSSTPGANAEAASELSASFSGTSKPSPEKPAFQPACETTACSASDKAACQRSDSCRADKTCAPTAGCCGGGGGCGGEEYVPTPSVSALAHRDASVDLSFEHARIALAVAANLGRNNVISGRQKAVLKDLIVRGDGRIAAAALVFDADGDANELRDTLMRISALSLQR